MSLLHDQNNSNSVMASPGKVEAAAIAAAKCLGL